MIKKFSKESLRKHSACDSGVRWFLSQKETSPTKVVEALIKEDNLDWANWAIVRCMTYKQYVSYAVFAAEQVIDIYEKKNPGDKRPRQAIAAAKKCIENPSKKNKDAAHAAANAANAAYAASYASYATYAADAAYAAYATYASYAVADAASYATNAADAATNAAAYAADAAANAAADAAAYAASYATNAAYAAAYAAANAAYAADAADATGDKMRIKLIRYGLKLLKSDSKECV